MWPTRPYIISSFVLVFALAAPFVGSILTPDRQSLDSRHFILHSDNAASLGFLCALLKYCIRHSFLIACFSLSTLVNHFLTLYYIYLVVYLMPVFSISI